MSVCFPSSSTQLFRLTGRQRSRSSQVTQSHAPALCCSAKRLPWYRYNHLSTLYTSLCKDFTEARQRSNNFDLQVWAASRQIQIYSSEFVLPFNRTL
jgi:hypothetical protein